VKASRGKTEFKAPLEIMSNALALPNTSITELDAFAWQAVCEWPQHSHINVVHQGIDYGLLTRYFLWDKVPRAVRQRTDPQAFAFEQTLLEQQRANAAVAQSPQWKQQLKRWVKQPVHTVDKAISSVKMQVRRRVDTAPVILVPRQHAYLRSTLSALLEDPTLRLVAPVEHGDQSGVRLFKTPLRRRPDKAFTAQLYAGMIDGLQAFDIELLPADRALLKQQLTEQMRLIRQVEAEIAVARPQAVLVFADTHSPLQEYVAIANRQGIPTILIQHGLDCEQYCLNHTQSTLVSVWGSARKARYQQQSQQQPQQIEVTGSPEFDSLQLPTQLCAGGDHWVWATRPHGSNKCLLPSRHPQEGAEILAALIAALKTHESAHLTIKPHPLDYIELYTAALERQGMRDRVTFSDEPLQTVLQSADIVISEDSTAALEAMFFGKIIIHVHFASSPPVLPLAVYGAALAADSHATLQTAMSRALSLDANERQQLQTGQHRFIQDYAGELDGQACERVTALISQAVSRTTK